MFAETYYEAHDVAATCAQLTAFEHEVKAQSDKHIPDLTAPAVAVHCDCDHGCTELPRAQGPWAPAVGLVRSGVSAAASDETAPGIATNGPLIIAAS